MARFPIRSAVAHLHSSADGSRQSSGLFLNGSFGIGPEFALSGVEGPSIFPRTAAGLRLAWEPAADSALRVALLNGVPVVRNDGSRAVFRRGDGALSVVEFAVLSRRNGNAERTTEGIDRIGRFTSLATHEDKLAVGLWRYSGAQDDLSDVDPAGTPLMRRGSGGFYAVGERVLSPQTDAVGAGRHLSGFSGIADPRTNRFAAYFGSGLVAAGWGPMRDADELGLAVAHAVDSSHYWRAARDAGGAAHAETTVELSLLVHAGKALAVQPDLQYVIRPSAAGAFRNAWVLQCRFRAGFGREANRAACVEVF